MASPFQQRRKEHRQTKVSDDNKAASPSTDAKAEKRKRRGVSVFQRQLFKRKQWVKEYESGKRKKWKAKEKMMQGYHSAMKELDKEHRAIFGHSLPGDDNGGNWKRKTPPSFTTHAANGNNLRFKSRDTWNELQNPTYQQMYGESDWSFLDTHDLQKDAQDKNNQKETLRGSNKSFIGNGKVNVAPNKRRQHAQQQQQEQKQQQQPRNGSQTQNTNRSQALNSYEKASIAAQRIRDEKDAVRRERDEQQMVRLKEISKAQRAKERRNKILNMRNKKGQPMLNKQVVLLLEQIQQNNKKQKTQSTSRQSNRGQNTKKTGNSNRRDRKRDYNNKDGDEDGDVSDLDMNDFLDG